VATDKANLLYRLGAAILLILALALRLGAVNNTVVDDPLRGDAHDYYSYALNLKLNHTFSRTFDTRVDTPAPDAVRAPGYPLMLAPLVSYPPDQQTIWHITLLQALLDCITVLLALAIFRHFMGAGWALGAALLVACSPHLISMSTYVLTETLFTFLTMLSLWLVIRAHATGSRALGMTAGVVIAAAALTRPTLQYFIVPAAGLLLMCNSRNRLRLAVPLVLGFVLLFMPWTIRNLVQTGAMSDPTLTINAYHHGMYPDFRFEDRPETTGFPYLFNPRSAEISASKQAVLAEITRHFREEPGRYIKWYLLGKPVSLLSWDIIAGMGDIFVYKVTASPFLSSPAYMALAALMKQLHWPLVILALCTTLLAWLPQFSCNLSGSQRFAVRLLSLLILYFIALHMVGAPFPRYGIPLRPAIYGLAVYFCSLLVTRLAGLLKRSRTLPEHV
jgi:4-amino-4-deoxy-L-arabinose transferase-like glycosyltransferase